MASDGWEFRPNPVEIPPSFRISGYVTAHYYYTTAYTTVLLIMTDFLTIDNNFPKN